MVTMMKSYKNYYNFNYNINCFQKIKRLTKNVVISILFQNYTMSMLYFFPILEIMKKKYFLFWLRLSTNYAVRKKTTEIKNKIIKWKLKKSTISIFIIRVRLTNESLLFMISYPTKLYAICSSSLLSLFIFFYSLRYSSM